MQWVQAACGAASEEQGRGQASTHQFRNVPLQFFIVVGVGVFQGRIKLLVPNVKGQEEERHPKRHLGRSIPGEGRGKYCAKFSAVAGDGKGGRSHRVLAWGWRLSTIASWTCSSHCRTVILDWSGS